MNSYSNDSVKPVAAVENEKCEANAELEIVDIVHENCSVALQLRPWLLFLVLMETM